MTKKEVVTFKNYVADELKHRKLAAKPVGREIYDALVDCLNNYLLEHKEMKLAGFGTFSIVENNRVKRNPRTGEVLEGKAKDRIKFKASNSIKSSIE